MSRAVRLTITPKNVALVILGLGVAAQLVPYGRDHSNPPVVKEPAWDRQQTRKLAKRACFDCHSNETIWPWYSHIAPASWLVQHDVNEARHKVDFSEWQKQYTRAKHAAAEVREGDMPLPQYLWLHPSARLSPTEKEALERGLAATLGVQAEDD